MAISRNPRLTIQVEKVSLDVFFSLLVTIVAAWENELQHP